MEDRIDNKQVKAIQTGKATITVKHVFGTHNFLELYTDYIVKKVQESKKNCINVNE